MSEQNPLQPDKGRLGPMGGFALLLSAFVGFNTLVTSCAAERASRDAALLQKIGQREQFWTQAIHDLDDILKDKLAAGSGSDAWTARCRLLAVRTAPFSIQQTRMQTFGASESALSDEILDMEARVGDLQAGFADQMRDTSLVGPTCALIFEAQLQRAADRQGLVTDFGPADEGPKLAADTPALPAARRDLIELTGLSEKGVDTDIFWCERRPADPGNAQEVREADRTSDLNFAEALKFASLVAARAAGGPLKDDPIGRVRVRILPASLQETSAYDGLRKGRNLQTDTSSEKAFGEQLKTFDERLTVVEKNPASGQPATNFYVSAFFCEHSVDPQLSQAPQNPGVPSERARSPESGSGRAVNHRGDLSRL